MTEPHAKLLVGVESHRERYVRVFGTADSLRMLVGSVQSAVESLPLSISGRQRVSEFYVGDAGGSKQEVYLSFHVVSSLDSVAGRQNRKIFRNFALIVVLIVFAALAVIGIGTVWHWIA